VALVITSMEPQMLGPNSLAIIRPRYRMSYQALAITTSR
jgi:hypothetical protein